MELQDIELKQNRRGVFSIFAALTLITVAAAVYYYYNTRSDLINHGMVQSRAIAEEKSKQLASWIKERAAEGIYLAKSPELIQSITGEGFVFMNKSKTNLTGIFEDLRFNHDYSTIALLSNSGETRLLTGEALEYIDGKKAAEMVIQSNSQLVIYDELSHTEPALVILTPVPLASKPVAGIIYQRIPVRKNLIDLLQNSDQRINVPSIRVFYFTRDTLFSLLDTLKPLSGLKLSDPPTIPETVYTLASENSGGEVHGEGFDNLDKIGYFKNIGSGLFLYFSLPQGTVVKPLIPIGILLTIIIFITLAAAGLGVSLILSRQQASYAGRLAESEAFLESLREGMSDGFILFDKEMRYLAVNSKAMSLLGRSREELAGLKSTEVFPGVEESGFWNSFHEVLRTGQPVTSVDYYPEWDAYFQNKMFPVKKGIAVFFSDITDETKLRQQLEDANEQLEALALHLQVATENEREAIAREIHDELGQVLTSLKMDLAIMRGLLGHGLSDDTRDKLLEEISSMGKRIDSTVKRLRRIITELRPEVLDHLGFVAAVEWLVEESAARSGVKFTLKKNIDSVQLEKHHATALFRIIQESCTNIIRHSEARNAEITLWLEGESFKLTIIDDGKGFATGDSRKISSFGLIGMKERAKLVKAELVITSAPGEGTKIELEVRKNSDDKFGL